MNFFKNRIFIFIILIAALTSCDFSKERIMIGYKPEKGKTYKYRVVVDSDLGQEMRGRKVNLKNYQEMVYSMKVDEINEQGDINITVSYDSIYQRSQTPYGVSEFNSSYANASSNPMGIASMALIESEIKLSMTAEGEIKEIKGIERVYEKISRKMSDMLGENAWSRVYQTIKAQFGEEAIKETYERMYIMIPEDSVAIGDKWSSEMVLSKGYPMVIKNDYRLASIRDSIAVIKVKSEIKPNPQPLSMGAMEVEYLVRGDQKGKIEYDISRNVLLKSKLNQNLTIDLNVVRPENMQGIKQKILGKNRVTYERIKIKE